MAETGRKEKDLPLVENFETVRAITADGKSVLVPKSKFGGNLEIAKEDVLGGVKASPRDETDTQEVKIDPNSGKLYCPPSEMSIATSEKLGGIVAEPKTEGYSIEAKIDPLTGKIFVPEGDGTPPDEEDITVASVGDSRVLQFKNRGIDKGMGYVILRTDSNLSSQLLSTNTIYEVRYNFNLGGGTISVPDNCVLKFEGGKFLNGTINGTFEVRAESDIVLFDGVTLTGRIKNTYIEADWFGLISESTNSALAINRAITVANSSNIVVLPRRTFTVSTPILINKTVHVDGRNYKHRIGGFYIRPTASISVFVIGSGFLDGSLRNVSINLASASGSLLRNYVGIEMTGCESFVVENIKVQYADIAYKLVTQTQISLPTFNDISAHECNTGVRIEGVGSGWANGISIKPYWFTNNYVHFHILGGQVTTIQGGSVEVGNTSTKPSWFGSEPRGIVTENDAVVNVFGCLWAENVNGTSTGYYVESKGFSVVNIYGDAWITENIIMSEYSKVNYYGSSYRGRLTYGAHSENVRNLPLYYVSSKNCKYASYFCKPIDCIGKNAPDWNFRIKRLADGTPYFSTVTLESNVGDGTLLQNFTLAMKYVKTSSSQVTLLLNGGWTNTITLTESSGAGFLRVKQGSNSKNAIFYKRTRRETSNYEEGVCIVSFDYTNNRVITMDKDYNFTESEVSFLNSLPFDPYNYVLNFNTDSGLANFYLTDLVVFDSILSAADFIWWMDYLKNGGADIPSIGSVRPDTAGIGHSFFNSSTGILSVKTSESFDSNTLTSVTWKDVNTTV